MSAERDEQSHLEPLEKELFSDIEEVFDTANDMATAWGYGTKGERIIAEHYTPDGDIDIRFEVHVTISKLAEEPTA